MELSVNRSSNRVYCRDIQTSLIAAFFQLSHLLEAGISVDQSLRELITLESRWGLRRVWRDVERKVVDGQALSSALAHWPTVFDSTVVALLKSGETSGQLTAACLDCQEYLDWQQSIKARISAVLFYPLFALVVVVSVLSFLMIYLVPSLEGLLKSSGYVFPWHSQLLLSLSQWAKDYLVVVLLALCACSIVMLLARSVFHSARVHIDSSVLRIPLYGNLLFNLSLSRYFETCSKLYSSGISLAESMEKSEAFIDNRALILHLRQARLKILEGKNLTTALSTIPWLPQLHIRVISAGEMSGKLVESLARTGSQLRQISEYKIDKIEKMTGPAVLIMAGALLLWIVLSLLAPLYQHAVDSVILA